MPRQKKKKMIQMATGRHSELLDLSESHHRKYCYMHSAYYERYSANPSPHLPDSWGRIALILESMDSGIDVCVWMDADAAVCDPAQDIFRACQHGVGAARYDSPFSHYQCGVLVCVKSSRVVKFFTDVLKSGIYKDCGTPGKYGQWEQHAINEIGIERGIISSISVRWNLVPQHAGHPKPAVLAAHGQPFEDRLSLVKRCSDNAFFRI